MRNNEVVLDYMSSPDPRAEVMRRIRNIRSMRGIKAHTGNDKQVYNEGDTVGAKTFGGEVYEFIHTHDPTDDFLNGIPVKGKKSTYERTIMHKEKQKHI